MGAAEAISPKSKLEFEDLHVLVGIAIVGLLVAAFFGAMVIAIVTQIARHPWVLLILVPLSITATLIDHSRGAHNAKADPTIQRGRSFSRKREVPGLPSNNRR